MNTSASIKATSLNINGREYLLASAFKMAKVWVIAVLFCAPAFFATTCYAREIVKFEAVSTHSPEKVTLRADLSKPEGDGPFPVVVLMHGCGGWQPAVRYALNAYADYLVAHGFAVLNLDSFGPRNNSGGKVCESNKSLWEALEYREYDAYDAYDYLKKQKFVDAHNIFLMGQSNGATVAINAAKANNPRNIKASERTFRGIVAYYPWCGTFGRNDVALASPLLIFAGGKDDWVPASECEGVKTTGAELQVKIYPEAAHSFDLEILPQRYLGKLIGNDKYAAQDSREKMLDFFIQNLSTDMKPVLLAKYGSAAQKN